MTIEELTMVYFAERHLEGIRDYMVRGRSFGDLTEEQLGAQWVKTYRAACDLDDDRSWDELIDLQREFSLRDIEPPMHLLAAEVALLNQRLDQRVRSGRPDPAAYAEIRAELAELAKRLRGPKH